MWKEAWVWYFRASLRSREPVLTVSIRSIDTDRVNSLAATTPTEGSTSTTTTEYPYAAIAKLYAKPRDKVGTIAYSSGVHKFRIGPGEDEQKRLLEEYHYHFERVEKNLPPVNMCVLC